jgi:hypothetical protein
MLRNRLKTPFSRIIRAHRSHQRPTEYTLDLTCGHQEIVFALTPPEYRDKVYCNTCAAALKEHDAHASHT